MTSLIPSSSSPPAEGLGFRVPPHNFEAEQALLGAILLSNRAYEKVSEFLRPEHFADPVHGRIFATCGKLIERGQMANPVTLKTYFEQDGGLTEIGGTPYLAQLANSVVSVINAEDYGKLVFDLHLRRELIGLGEDLVNDAFAPDLESTAMDQIGGAEAKLYDLATTGQTEGGFEDFKSVLIGAIAGAEAAHKRQGKLSGVPTGLIDMDSKLGGLHESDLLILAGRPSMGKTSLATNIAFNAAYAYKEEIDALGRKKGVDGAITAFFSLEMSSEQLATRILAEQAEIASHKIRQGELSNEEFERLVIAAQNLHRLPLFIDDTPALSISAVRTRARRLQRQHGLGLIVIDYLQLLRGSSANSENRVQEVSEITRGLKALAKELSLPVIALSQLSRAVEQREDKRPQLSDLRESGSIEQDADVVMFVYREQYYLERAEPGRRPDEAEDKFNERHSKWQQRCEEVWNTAEVIIAKQRHGPVGTVRLSFQGEYTKFGNLAASDHYEEPGF
ncbi:Replicative DNA helicase [Candidatus Terasakiella magnetica]|nr:Replicative DNA helicase [Candidatus Terasakiella magnetica]